MVRAWVYKEQVGVDQREPHQHTPNLDVPLSTLSLLGVHYWKIDPTGCEEDTHKGQLGEIRKQRNYKGNDIVCLTPEKLPNYDAKIKMFFEEHIHEDEEIRFVLEGQGYFDIRNDIDMNWIRIFVESGDMIVLPAGMYHRFTLDTKNYIKVIRLFQDLPKWEAINRGQKAEINAARAKYLDYLKTNVKPDQVLVNDKPSTTHIQKTVGLNGESYTLLSGAQSYANYPHMRAVNGMLYLSGMSCRQPDNSHKGVIKKDDGSVERDIKLQTAAVLENIQATLQMCGATLKNIVEMNVYLVDMNDYAGMNEVYNHYFPVASDAPVRTTVAVHQLPHQHLCVEMKCVAVDPRQMK